MKAGTNIKDGDEMEYKYIQYKLEDGVAVITFNRPKAWNALCEELYSEIIDVVRNIDKCEEVRVLILTGGSKVFAAGADIKQMTHATPAQAARTCERGHMLNDLLEELPFPVIAAINGPALGGGCELAISCDFRVAGENAVFAFPEVGLGILPGAGGTQRMTQLIGSTRTREMILLGRRIKGWEAYEMGLATKVVADDQVWDEALKMAETLKKLPSYACAMAKKAIHMGELYGMATGKRMEQELFSLCFSNPDQTEGMMAFQEKRTPDFKNGRE